jgi:uncharacterized metal-binding protein YceD (DUF177 family)
LKIENRYSIQFKGLKEGIHEFEFILGKPFFEEFERLEVQDGKVTAGITLERKTSMLDLEIRLKGDILVTCDRCLENFWMGVEYSGHLVVQFSEREQEGNDEIIYLHPEEYQLDLKHYLYESISVSIPYRKVHPDLPGGGSGCDPEMLGKLESLIINT